MWDRGLRGLVILFLAGLFFASGALFSSDGTEDVAITKEGERTRIVVKTPPTEEKVPESNMFTNVAKGFDGLAYGTTKASADVMGKGGDTVSGGMSAIGGGITNFFSNLFGKPGRRTK
ncbi:MAG: hypothetical protein PHE61_01565 [Candidatus Omnitrophica bacterium]|nr:hypothetical protein [Candidatus Omnitrophota bacterium]